MVVLSIAECSLLRNLILFVKIFLNLIQAWLLIFSLEFFFLNNDVVTSMCFVLCIVLDIS
jgi:hypothetical protein